MIRKGWLCFVNSPPEVEEVADPLHIPAMFATYRDRATAGVATAVRAQKSHRALW